MGLQYTIFNKMPWYHKLWLIPLILTLLCIFETWSYIKEKLGHP
ncbi:hypothetical protein SAMN04488542_11044 [Fontibacillus panacisegetis]|uniref:Uncharacterized protein n=1 Tax=Fontibacillus panacisegetis TaxID=670482 RepID=A0A1G7KRE1_9BACL|nr:hypothetical protein SAMN04488542_11044 [Fontibacillus panacisegetis]